MKIKHPKKITNKEVEKAYEILKIKKEQDIDDFFRCRCPKEIQAIRAMGDIHRTPIDCVTTPKEILRACDYYIKDLTHKLADIKLLKNKTLKKLKQ